MLSFPEERVRSCGTRLPRRKAIQYIREHHVCKELLSINADALALTQPRFVVLVSLAICFIICVCVEIE